MSRILKCIGVPAAVTAAVAILLVVFGLGMYAAEQMNEHNSQKTIKSNK